jgi:hypothetical protein
LVLPAAVAKSPRNGSADVTSAPPREFNNDRDYDMLACSAVRERLHTLADAHDDAIIQRVRGDGSTWKSASSEQKATLLRDALLPIPRSGGKFLYAVARSIAAKRIVEFGTSWGIPLTASSQSRSRSGTESSIRFGFSRWHLAFASR